MNKQVIAITYLPKDDDLVQEAQEKREIVQDIAKVLSKHGVKYVIVDDEDLMSDKFKERIGINND